MARRLFSTVTIIAGAVVAVGLTACIDGSATQLDSHDPSPSFAAHAEQTELNQSLAVARAATADTSGWRRPWTPDTALSRRARSIPRVVRPWASPMGIRH